MRGARIIDEAAARRAGIRGNAECQDEADFIAFRDLLFGLVIGFVLSSALVASCAGQGSTLRTSAVVAQPEESLLRKQEIAGSIPADRSTDPLPILPALMAPPRLEDLPPHLRGER